MSGIFTSLPICSKHLLPCTRILPFIPRNPLLFPVTTSTIQKFLHVPVVGVISKNQKINRLLKSGYLSNAMEVFDSMSERDVVTWNMVIAWHARLGFPQQALGFFREMVSLEIEETATTLTSVLAICNDFDYHLLGLQVHSRVVLLGFQSNCFIGSALVNLYMKIGCPDLAMRAFSELLEPNTETCNVVLRGFLELDMVTEMLKFFLDMKYRDIEANGVSFTYLTSGCCDRKFIEEGKQLHCQVIKVGLSESSIFVSNALVDLYSAHSELTDMERSLDLIRVHDVISWNSVIAANAGNGRLMESVRSFHMMLQSDMKASVRSIVALLNLASKIDSISVGVQIHGFALKSGHVDGSVHVQSALIDMYGKSGRIRRSLTIFDEAKKKGLECCNSLITSFLHCNAPEDAIEMFGIAADEGVKPDSVMLSAVLRALSNSSFASLISCKEFHSLSIKSGFETDVAVSSSLINAYAKCGNINISRQIFDGIRSPNIVCYTALVAGYAQNGRGKEGVELLNKMIEDGLRPDAVTLLSVLAGCDHSGLIDVGRSIFESMKAVYGVEPDQRHYSCMVSLLGRAGLVEEAVSVAEAAPERKSPAMWSSLLQSCRLHGNEDVGRRVAEILLKLKPRNPAICFQVSEFHSEITNQNGSASVREAIGVYGSRKEIGHSLIQVAR